MHLFLCCHLCAASPDWKQFLKSCYLLCSQAIWWEEACRFQSHARPQWVPDPGMKRAVPCVPGSMDFLLATVGTWIHLQWFWQMGQGSGSKRECWFSQVLTSGPVPELDPMGPRGLACLFLGEVTILIHLSIFKKKKRKTKKKVCTLVGVCFRKNMKWVGSVDLLSLPWQQVDGASCQRYFFPVCTEVFNPCKACRAEGEVMLEWDGPWILYKNSWFCHYEHFVYHCSCESRSEFAQPDLLTIQSLLIQKKHILYV